MRDYEDSPVCTTEKALPVPHKHTTYYNPQVSTIPMQISMTEQANIAMRPSYSCRDIRTSPAVELRSSGSFPDLVALADELIVKTHLKTVRITANNVIISLPHDVSAYQILYRCVQLNKHHGLPRPVSHGIVIIRILCHIQNR